MEESVLVNKAENYLKEIANDSISLVDIDEFDNFKNLYFKLVDRLDYLQKLKDGIPLGGHSRAEDDFADLDDEDDFLD